MMSKKGMWILSINYLVILTLATLAALVYMDRYQTTLPWWCSVAYFAQGVIVMLSFVVLLRRRMSKESISGGK